MWHSYLINLDKNKARLENSARQLDAENIAFTRIDAVNGWAMDEKQIENVYDARAARQRYKYQLIKPEIGCYLSHMEAWRIIAESGKNGGFVFEDDFEIVSPLSPILEQLSDADQDWDIVKLFSIKENPKNIKSEKLDTIHDIVTPYQVPTCLLGYGITASAAKHLLETSVPFFRPVDEDHKFFWEKDIKVSLVTPSPIKVGDQQAQTGTIGSERSSGIRTSLMARIARSYKSVAYQINYKLRLHFHRKFRKHL
ncbi:MAG: glycosyltransferase family 25 protein [Hyphomicrobiales bacterium]|nr:glycosyltransferase family 25 protein [Hyphomicrobiales bacterium]